MNSHERTQMHDELTLPEELWETIINDLDDDEDSLKRCALTCRLFTPVAQKLFFKHVEIDFLFDSASKFLAILEDSNHIRNYVRQVSLFDTRSHSPFQDQHSATTEDAIERILSMLNLTKLKISRKAYGPFIQFAALKPSLQNRIFETCRTLCSLTFKGVQYVPLRILANIRTLKKIKFQDVLFAEDEDSEGPYHWSSSINMTPSYFQLRHLSILGTFVGGQSILPLLKRHGLGFQRLESLTINMDYGWLGVPASDFHAVRWMIKTCAKSLRTLNLTVATNLPVLLPENEVIFDISALPLLEKLSLTGALFNSETYANASPINQGWLSKHLETIPTSRKFKSIELHSIITTYSPLDESEFDEQGLKYFENLILTKVLERTSHLSIIFRIWGSGGISVRDILKERLPILWEQTLLKFYTDSDDEDNMDEDGSSQE